MWDQLQQFIFDDCAMRGVLVRLDKSIADNMQHHDYPAAVHDVLAQALTAICLLTTTVKLQGRVSLQLQNIAHAESSKSEQAQAPLRLLLAECTDDLGLRGIATMNDGFDGTHLNFKQLTRDGMLVLSLIPDQGNPYQGVVPLQGDSLSSCLEHYFMQSEQLATLLLIFVEGDRSAGLLLQALPNADEEDVRRLHALAGTLRADEALGLAAEELLWRLFHEEQVRLFEPRAVRFQCRCSRSKSLSTLRTLEQSELQDIIRAEGQISVQCEFCRQTYLFDGIDIASLNTDLPGSDSAH